MWAVLLIAMSAGDIPVVPLSQLIFDANTVQLSVGTLVSDHAGIPVHLLDMCKAYSITAASCQLCVSAAVCCRLVWGR